MKPLILKAFGAEPTLGVSSNKTVPFVMIRLRTSGGQYDYVLPAADAAIFAQQILNAALGSEPKGD